MKSISLNKPTKVYAKVHDKYSVSPITHAPLGDHSRPYLYHSQSSVNIASENHQTATDILREKSQAALQASRTRERLSSREGKGFIGLYGSDYSSIKGRNSKLSTPSSEKKRIKDVGISPLSGVKAYARQLPTIISQETQNTQRQRKSRGGIFGGLLKDPFEEQNRRVQQMAQWRKVLDEQVFQKKMIKEQEKESRRVQELQDEERYRRQQRQLIYTYGTSHRQKSMEHAASHKMLKPMYYIDSPQTTSQDYQNQNHYSASPVRFSRNESESEIKPNAVSGSTINNFLDSLKQDIFMSRKIFQDHIKVLKHEIEKSSQVHSKTDRRSYIFRRESPVPSRFSLHNQPTSDIYDQRNSTMEEQAYSRRTRNSISTKDLRFTPIQEHESDLDEVVSIKYGSPGPSGHNSIIRIEGEQRSELSESNRAHFMPRMKKVKSNAFRERVLSSKALEDLENKWQYQSQASGKPPTTNPGTPKNHENPHKIPPIQSMEISNTSGTDESIFPTTERGPHVEQTDSLLQHFRSASNPVELRKFDGEEESPMDRLPIIGKHTSRFVDTKEIEELKYVNEQEIIQEVQEVMAEKEPVIETPKEEEPTQSKQLPTHCETIPEKEESLQEDTTVKADETPSDNYSNQKREKVSENLEENIANRFEWVTDLTFKPNEDAKAKQRRGIQRTNQVGNKDS